MSDEKPPLIQRWITFDREWHQSAVGDWVQWDDVKALVRALEESVALQSHYAKLLNMHDGGERLQFANAQAWLDRLKATTPIVTHVCGGAQARICPVTKQPHDMSAVKWYRDGGSAACKDCGVTEMSLDLLELP